MNKEEQYWFRANSYGWGWGLPLKWQGWLVLTLYTAGIAAANIYFSPAVSPTKFTLAISVLSGLLVAVCWKTGEPPSWRWGKK